MRISIFGLGYVGSVSAACFAAEGHQVIGIDINPDKVAAIHAGESPIVEPGLKELLRQSVRAGNLRATTEASEAISHTDLSFVCVGTPSQPNGALDLQYVRRVCEAIAKELGKKLSYHTVVIRSTVLPGTTENIIRPLLEDVSAKSVGKDFGLVFNPEFLREGSAIRDFNDPPRTVLGEWDEFSGDRVAPLYERLDAPLVRSNLRVAEMVKYADNAFHALKISFANEIGNFCKAEGIDSHDVMDIFCLDTKLNLSPAYLRPGNAFGGSCLPKDIRALLYRMKRLDLEAPLLESLLPSNELQKSRVIDLVRQNGKTKIGVLGLSFKPSTDDLRESPTVHMVETLIGKGYQVKIFDPNLSLNNLVGSNRAFIDIRLPHISSLLTDNKEKVLAESEVIVVTNNESIFADVPALLKPDQILVDLVRLFDEPNGLPKDQYYGISW